MFPVRKKGSIFSPELQRKLMKAYEEDYRELAIRYLGREDGVFFQEPWVVDEEGGIPSLSPDSVASLLMLMQRDHQRKVDRLKRKTLSGRLKRLFK
jgi:hypothetical protein